MEALGAAGWDASAKAWIARIDSGDPARQLLLDDAVLELLGSVSGCRLLDLGCGEGRACRMLAERGAHTVGVDPCAELVDAARARDPHGLYVRASGEDLPFSRASFDLALAYLVLIDIPDFRRAICEVARVLKPGGRLIVANLISFRTASDLGWECDADGNRLYVAVGDYFDERSLHAEWSGISVTNFHRPLAAYFSAFTQSGFLLSAYREPRPTREQVAANPSLESDFRVPLFDVAEWVLRPVLPGSDRPDLR